VLVALKNNFGLKVLSIGLAVVAWAYFHLAAAPGTIARFDQTLSVPIVVSGLRPGYQARYAEKVATVVVEVPRNGTPVRAEQLQAVLDLADVTEAGYHNVPLKIVSPEIAVRSLSPASVTLSVDRIEDRSVRISIEYAGERRGTVVESAQVTPATTTIRGVAADLAKVATVRVGIPIAAGAGRLDAMIRPTPVNARGAEVPNVDISPNLVRVRAKFVHSTTTEQK
jgi:hypothetical protein